MCIIAWEPKVCSSTTTVYLRQDGHSPVRFNVQLNWAIKDVRKATKNHQCGTHAWTWVGMCKASVQSCKPAANASKLIGHGESAN